MRRSMFVPIKLAVLVLTAGLSIASCGKVNPFDLLNSVTTAPQVNVSPTGMTTNAAFSVTMTISTGIGYWSTNALSGPYESFSISTNITISSGIVPLFTFGKSIDGASSATNLNIYSVIVGPTVPPNVTPSKLGLTTNETFTLTLTTTKASGYWSTNGGVSYTSFNPTANITVDRTMTVHYFGYNASDGSSVTNSQTYTITATAGDNWIQTAMSPFSTRAFGTATVFNGGIWVIGGNHEEINFCNDVYHSTDGTTWVEATNALWSAGRYGHGCIAYNGKLWVTGGMNQSITFHNDVYSSVDGTNWTLVTASAAFSARASHRMLSYNGKMWLIGGSRNYPLTVHNDVWYSTDGITWTLATASAGFGARWGHSAVVYDSKMWVIGGWSGSSTYNDMWYSTDGITWTSAGAPGYSSRYYSADAVHEGKIWIIGGQTSTAASSRQNDVWYYDGTWHSATAAAPFSKSAANIAVSFGGALWNIGGILTDNSMSAEVWKTQ